ncbi:hypothetical protein ND747_16305, partial [Frankia sp. R82]|nr:hypothetical protein [Frankia sp. R82]
MTTSLDPAGTELMASPNAAPSGRCERAPDVDAVGDVADGRPGSATSAQDYLAAWARAARGGRPRARMRGRSWGALAALTGFALVVVVTVVLGMAGLPGGHETVSADAAAVVVSPTLAASTATHGSSTPGRTASDVASSPTTPVPSTPVPAVEAAPTVDVRPAPPAAAGFRS